MDNANVTKLGHYGQGGDTQLFSIQCTISIKLGQVRFGSKQGGFQGLCLYDLDCIVFSSNRSSRRGNLVCVSMCDIIQILSSRSILKSPGGF